MTAERLLRVSLSRQCMDVMAGDSLLQQYPVSTARNGAGERNGSGCTPRGWLVIRAKIGAGCCRGTVFVGRRPTGEYYDEDLAARHPDRDWILSRILWLSGLEAGFNRYGTVDTARRYIYIHGSPDSGVTGTPASHGCIRMRQDDVMALFEQVAAGTRVRVEP
ncbi:MAG: hypothetical protein RLZZ226_728 [Pseudomonadota bacterium]